MARPAASPEQREQQRQHIRRAAATLHRSNGAAGVSVRAVAKEAGVSPGAIYSYFANLSELMRSLWLEPVMEANRELASIGAAIDDPVERIRALLEAYVEFGLSNAEVYRGALMFVRPGSAPEPEVNELETLPLHRLLVGALDEGQATEAIQQCDSTQTAQLLWAGVHGALALPINMDTYAVAEQAELAGAMIDRLIGSLVVPR